MKYKEYLCKTDDGYILQTLPEHAGSGLIEVPSDAEFAVLRDGNVEIRKGLDCFIDKKWEYGGWRIHEFIRLGYKVVWQRQAQPESLNEQYAEIEKVRQDAVNHPSHYTNGKVECIDALESATVGKNGIEAVCVANVIKYLWRYEDKNGIEDVRKAQWYLNRLLSAMGD